MDERFLSIAADEAHKSTGHFRHGAVIVANHKLIAAGHNSADRTVFNGVLTGCCHAEHAVLHQYYQTCIQRKVAEETQS